VLEDNSWAKEERGSLELTRQHQVSAAGDSGSRLGDGDATEDGRLPVVGGEDGHREFVGVEEETLRVCFDVHVSTSKIHVRTILALKMV